MSLRGDCPYESRSQPYVQHACLVHDEEVAGQRVAVIHREPSVRGVELQQTMNGLGEMRRAFRHSASSPACWCSQKYLCFFALRIETSARRMVVLPVPGPPVRMETLEARASLTPLD